MQTTPINRKHEVFALLENTRNAPHETGTLLFNCPVTEICCHDGPKLDEALRLADRLRREGFHLCGYVAYEAAYFLTDKRDFAFNRQPASATPLLHFYAFQERHSLTPDQSSAYLQRLSSAGNPVAIKNLALNMNKKRYAERIERIRQYIREGDSYQVNFTLKYRFEYQGGHIALYRRLRDQQRVEFGALLNFPEFGVLSLSPELFLRKQGATLESKPMKGTWARGASPAEDREIVTSMRLNPKMLSENIMIVDLIRSDIGRVAETGSVSVENLFEVQTFETLHQMISTVKGRIAPDKSLGEIFRQLFPCGSITGAPKIRTMQIIEELETEPRGVYTGAIGYLGPDNDFCFNVPIRTCIAYPDGTAEMGVGGGILHESDTFAEYEECILKARFLAGVNDAFQLIESMRYRSAGGNIDNLDRHLARMESSATELHFIFNREGIVRAIGEAIRGLHEDYKLRLILHRNGRIDINLQSIDDTHDRGQPRHIDISEQIIDRDWFLLRHKTTERSLYEREFDKCRAVGVYDVLFLNDAGHVTEASRHNVFVEKDGLLLTSPVAAGLLGGIAREVLMTKEMDRCVERPLMPSDLLSADRILLTNAVRGVVEVSLTPKSRSALANLAAKGNAISG